MTATPTWLDRLRIEGAVRTVDMLTSTLPARRKRAIRGELRANLRAAAAEVGAREAVRRLGSLRRLANGYLDAELGEGRSRPQLLKAVLWLAVVQAFVIAVALTANQAFMDGVLAGSPHATGTYAWHALAPVVPEETVTVVGGRVRSFGLTLNLYALPIVYVVAFVLGGRLWRLLPRRR